jgi:hypothetical protein
VGPDSNSGPMAAYLDGQPVEIGNPLPEITPDYSAGGVTAEEAVQAAERLAAAMGGIGVTIEVAEDGLRAFFYSLELSVAVYMAQIFKPELVHRYRRTKKKRTRKNTKSGSWPGFGRCGVNVETESQQNQPLQAGGQI